MPCRCGECKKDTLADFIVKAGYWWDEVVRRTIACVRCHQPGCPAALTCRGIQCLNNPTRSTAWTPQIIIPSPYPMTIPEDR